MHDGFLDIRAGIIRDTNVLGPNNDITDDLDTFFNADSADFKRSTLFIWGEHYANSGGGVHQLHMNQGNYMWNRRWYRENGRGQDGGIVMRLPDSRRWKYLFIAFAGQASKTDEDGKPTRGEATPMLRDIIPAPPPSCLLGQWFPDSRAACRSTPPLLTPAARITCLGTTTE
jgi:uncharacterized protein YukJ